MRLAIVVATGIAARLKTIDEEDQKEEEQKEEEEEGCQREARAIDKYSFPDKPTIHITICLRQWALCLRTGGGGRFKE